LVNQAVAVDVQKFPPFGGSNWQNPLPFDSGLIDADDLSNAILYLVTDSGRYVTGTTMRGRRRHLQQTLT
jgi:hypothetical protein